MKKIAYALIATLLITNFLTFTPSAEISDEQFTHTVFAEEFTATWCVYCPSAAENLMLVYEDAPGEPYYDDNFFFVALITDVNDKADDRMGDFPDVTGYPTVIFDGNDEKVSGGQSNTANFEQAIDTTGQRDDTDISLEIEMNHLGNDKLGISIGMTWNEDGSFSNPTFNGYVRAYIVEKISRYNNYDGDPYHFGFLDYAFDQNVELEPREKQSLNTIWTGGDHQDKNGNDFSDIDYNNINVFVAFFNDESTASDKYSLQSAFAIPPVIEVASIEHEVNNQFVEVDDIAGGDLRIRGLAQSEKSEINELTYRWNNRPWQSTGVGNFNGEFEVTIDTTEVENGLNSLEIKTENTGASNTKLIEVNVLNDFENPNIEIISHYDGDTVNEITVFEVVATDDNQIDKVQFNVNNGELRTMYSSTDDKYIASWNTQEADAGNGEHILSFKATDKSGNHQTQTINLTVFNEGDVTYPSLKIILPEDEIYNSRVKIEVQTNDPEGIKSVEYKVDGNDWKDMDNQNGNIFATYWTPYTDGWHDLLIRSTDNQDYSTNLSTIFETDSNPPYINLNSNTYDVSATAKFDINVEDYSDLQSLRYRIDGMEWINLDETLYDVSFVWDSTKHEDGECLLEIECVDKWGATNKIYKNVKVKNKGLINSVAPSNIQTNNVIEISAIIDYESPKSVNLVIAKFDSDVLSEGQKLPMRKEGDYYYGDLYFEDSGTYVYSIEIDTGHGKLKSYEQNILVSEEQTEIVKKDDESALVSLNFGPIVFIIIIIAARKK
ncbi:MAG: Ig-like domain-containing protein [Candidatus Poseidoniales archaeon]